MIYPPHKTFKQATQELDAKMHTNIQDAGHHQLALYAAQRACDNSHPSQMADVAVRTYCDVLDGLAKPKSAEA